MLIIVGIRTIKPKDVVSVWNTGMVQRVVMATTLLFTILIPLQYAVLLGVALSMLLYIIRSSSIVVVKQLDLKDGDIREIDRPESVGADEVIMLQLYGSIFFASAATFETLFPNVTDETRNSVVILRLRGKSDLGGTFMDILGRYAEELREHDSRLVVISIESQVLDQMVVTGTAERIGTDNIYPVDDWLGRELRSAFVEAEEWVETNKPEASPSES